MGEYGNFGSRKLTGEWPEQARVAGEGHMSSPPSLGDSFAYTFVQLSRRSLKL
jgi:hypothetical protein